MTIAEWLRRNAHWHRSKEALVDGERRMTYGELNDRANRQAAALAAEGLVKGDRVAVVLNNSLEAVEALAAAAKGGFVHVPINVRLSAREIGEILRDSGSRMLLIDATYRERLDHIGDCPGLLRTVIVEPGEAASDYESWLAEYAPDEPRVDVSRDDDFLIVYTSGTTGRPKGALFQHSQSTAHAPVPVLEYEIEEKSRLLLVYPHNSVASINMFYVPAWMVGASVVVMDVRQFSAERWLDIVGRERVTHCHLVPTMLFRVLDSPALEGSDLTSLRTIGYGSAPMPRERVEQLARVFGPILVQGYGMTETSSLAAVLSKADHVAALEQSSGRLNACGRPVFGCEVRVVDESGRDVRPGELGEVIFRGAYVTKGYWHDPERTAEAIRDGWLRSGDIAMVDDDGYLYIVDRKKDLIISGGANISSREVEDVLYWHPAVREAVVIARPDDDWGEAVHAFVALHETATATPEELIDFCRERLAHYKCPRQIEILPDLPKNALGKFLKSELRAPFWEGRQRGVN